MSREELCFPKEEAAEIRRNMALRAEIVMSSAVRGFKLQATVKLRERDGLFQLEITSGSMQRVIGECMDSRDGLRISTWNGHGDYKFDAHGTSSHVYGWEYEIRELVEELVNQRIEDKMRSLIPEYCISPKCRNCYDTGTEWFPGDEHQDPWDRPCTCTRPNNKRYSGYDPFGDDE